MNLKSLGYKSEPIFKVVVSILFSALLADLAVANSNLDIQKYQVRLEVNFANKSISGSTTIKFNSSNKNAAEFPLSGLLIESVFLNGKSVLFEATATNIKIELPKLKRASLNELTINYRSTSTPGLVWSEKYVYTNFEPCTWMICRPDPGSRAQFELELKLPNEMKSVASGTLKSISAVENNIRKETWLEPNKFSSYLYGFAVGLFTRESELSGSTTLEYLSTTDTSNDLKKKFSDTKRVISFFETKSGVPLPLKKYTQIIVNEDEAQEKHAFSILGKRFIDPILQDPTEDWIIVHELAHQWWGNMITCKSWDHFWLNEGIVVFMTAAYKQNRWGQAAYDREMELALQRYQRAKDAKFDVPLTYAGDYPSLGIKRAITYSKGALFLDALRNEVGEKAFWSGFKKYTQENKFKSVVSQDFQKAMESAAGKSLSEIFRKWVY